MLKRLFSWVKKRIDVCGDAPARTAWHEKGDGVDANFSLSFKNISLKEKILMNLHL